MAADPVRRAGLVLVAYDGSELAEVAITEAAAQLGAGRDALVVCVWQPADVGFAPVNARHLNADQATEVHRAAEETAAHGASIAQRAGFHARSLAVESAPTWRGIVQTAEERGAGLIVIGSHQRPGLLGHLVGRVAVAVLTHASCPVLVVHQPSRP